MFLELPLSLTQTESPKQRLLSELRRIYRRQWIASQKLAADGTKQPYAARNGGGLHPRGRAWNYPQRLC